MNQPLLPAPSQLRREIGLPQRSSRSTELAISLVARVGEKVATTTSLVLQIAFVCFCLLSVIGCCCLFLYLLFLTYAVVVPVVLLSNAVFVASIISCYCVAFALLFGSCSRCVHKKI